MARLYKLGPAWYLDWHERGQRFRRSLGAVDRQTAEAIQAEKEAELHGLITPTRGVTVNHVVGVYLQWYEKARPTTYRRAKSALAKFTGAFGALAAEGLDADKVEVWEVNCAARGSAHKAVKLAKAAFRRAVRTKLIKLNPMDAVQATEPPVSRAPGYYRPKQLETLYKAARGPLWRFMANTGVRRGEMAKARRSDVRGTALYVESVPTGRTKSGKWRAVPLNPAARKALESLGRDRLVDAHPDTLSDWFREDARGMPGTLHWLRHTFCTALVQSGVSLYVVQKLAGHSSITVTEKYAHHAPMQGVEAVEKIAEWHSSRHSSKPRKPRKSAPHKARPRSSAG